jgi:hypothetical protein
VRAAVGCHLLTTWPVSLTTQRDVRKDMPVAHKKEVQISESSRRMSFTDNRACYFDNTARCQEGHGCSTQERCADE